MSTLTRAPAITFGAADPGARIVRVRGDMFAVELREKGSGQPLLVLHDLIARFPWAPYLDDLAASYRVIAPRLPGFGYSTGLEHLDTPVDVAIFLTDLLDELDLPQVAVLGHDLGAMFAAELAAISPSRVSKVVLVAPVGLRADGSDMADMAAISPGEIPPLLWKDPSSAEAKAFAAMPSDPALVEEESVLRARALASASRFTWPFPERGLEKRVHRMSAPALLLWGESDGLVPPAMSAPFLAGVTGSRLETVPGAAHFPMLEQREAFVAAVKRFLG